MNESMWNAYGAARRIVDAEMAPEDRDLLRSMTDRDVVVVSGTYDRVEQVLRLAGVPHGVIEPSRVAEARLHPRQVVVVNCPGTVGEAGVARLRDFVHDGGTLFTTDWALKHLVEPAFPGTVAFNGRPTGDEVVRIERKAGESAFLDGLFHEQADPLWWLEGSSYPIRVLNPQRVAVLIASQELGRRYGEPAVAVAFTWGTGDVLHMISHYYLQRAELRTERHRGTWTSYAAEVGRSDAAASAPAEYDALSAGEVEAAHKSLRLMTNVLLEKQRRNNRRPQP